MFWLALIAFAAGSFATALIWEVFFCDPLRRQVDELNIHLVRKDLRAAADRFGYVDYRLQHRGTPYIKRDNRDHSKSAELRVIS